MLLGAIEAYRAARGRGLGVELALDRARTKAAADPFVSDCLAADPHDALGPDRDAA